MAEQRCEQHREQHTVSRRRSADARGQDDAALRAPLAIVVPSLRLHDLGNALVCQCLRYWDDAHGLPPVAATATATTLASATAAAASSPRCTHRSGHRWRSRPVDGPDT